MISETNKDHATYRYARPRVTLAFVRAEARVVRVAKFYNHAMEAQAAASHEEIKQARGAGARLFAEALPHLIAAWRLDDDVRFVVEASGTHRNFQPAASPDDYGFLFGRRAPAHKSRAEVTLLCFHRMCNLRLQAYYRRTFGFLPHTAGEIDAYCTLMSTSLRALKKKILLIAR